MPRRMTATLLGLAALAIAAATPGAAAAQAFVVDPEAVKILQRTMDYLSTLQQFSVDTHNTVEEVLDSGQKVLFDFQVAVTVQRPNKLRAERHGDIIDQSWYYDGKTLTLYNASHQFYASAAAPGTIEEMLDFARESLGLVAPASDLLYRNAFPLLMQHVYSAIVVGKAVIGGVKCDHLAFSRPDVAFQIWVPDAGQPLPQKYVVTATQSFGQPNTIAVMSNWNLAPKLTDATFTFVAPKDAQQTDFLRLDASSSASQ